MSVLFLVLKFLLGLSMVAAFGMALALWIWLVDVWWPSRAHPLYDLVKEIVLGVLKWAGIVVGGFVALVIAVIVLVALANRPSTLAFCTDAVATTVAGEVHLTCAD